MQTSLTRSKTSLTWASGTTKKRDLSTASHPSNEKEEGSHEVGDGMPDDSCSSQTRHEHTHQKHCADDLEEVRQSTATDSEPVCLARHEQTGHLTTRTYADRPLKWKSTGIA